MNKYYRLFGIIILAVILIRIDFQKLIVQFSSLNLAAFFMINLLVLPSLFFRSYRWRYLLRMQGIDYSTRDSFVSYLAGFYAGIITPVRLGETVKAAYLKKDKNIPVSEGLASVFMDRLIDFYSLLLLSGIALFHFLNMDNARHIIIISVVYLFLFGVPFLLINKLLLERIVRSIYNRMIAKSDNNLFEGQFKVFFSAVKKIISRRIYFPFVLTAIAFLFYFWQCYLLAHLASIDISYIKVVYFVSIASLISILPITIFGLGTREASLVYLFSLSNLTAESAIAYSFLLFISFYVLSGFLAFIGWLIREQKHKGSKQGI